jgi:hypothetical protein
VKRGSHEAMKMCEDWKRCEGGILICGVLNAFDHVEDEDRPEKM